MHVVHKRFTNFRLFWAVRGSLCTKLVYICVCLYVRVQTWISLRKAGLQKQTVSCGQVRPSRWKWRKSFTIESLHIKIYWSFNGTDLLKLCLFASMYSCGIMQWSFWKSASTGWSDSINRKGRVRIPWVAESYSPLLSSQPKICKTCIISILKATQIKFTGVSARMLFQCFP